MSIDLAKSNRNEPNEALLVIVRDASLSIWNKRGDEGMNSSSAGGQSFIYEDISQKIQDEIIRANLRLFRL